MTYFDRRNATKSAAREIAAIGGRHIPRARAEAANSTAEREPVAFDLRVADEVARIMGRLSKPVSAII